MQNGTPNRRPLTLVPSAALLAVVAVGCSSSPTGPTGGNDGGDQPPLADTPVLPAPASPTADVPQTSDTLTKITLLSGSYRPEVARMSGAWSLEGRECTYDVFSMSWAGCFGWITVPPDSIGDNAWSDDLPYVTFPTYVMTMSFPPPVGRLLLVKSGANVPTVDAVYDDSYTYLPSRWDRHREFHSTGLADAIYVRRDRVWERTILDGGAGEYLLLIGDVDGSISTTFTQGTSTVETQRFGETLSESGGLDIGVLSANISSTLSQTFATSVTVSEERSETFTKTVHGTAGKTVRFMVWELVERYMFTNANGEPVMAPNLNVVPDTLVRHGVATALQATEF